MLRSIQTATRRGAGLALILLMACSLPVWAGAAPAGTDLGPAPSVVLYGTLDAGSNSSQVFEVLSDNSYLALGPVLLGNDLEGMDINPLTGDMYAITNSGAFAGSLWKVDRTTGALTLIGNTGLTELQSLAFNPVTGELWTFKHLTGLFTIDLATAVPTFKYVPTGTGVFKSWEGLAWDNTGTFLYGENRAILYRTDPATQQTQVLCTNLTVGEGLDFAPDGTLYGGLDPNDPAELRIFKIDYNTCTTAASGFNLPLGDVESISFVPGGCTGEIGDFIWNDLNTDGLQDAGEPGIPGVTVTLRDATNAVIATTTTDANGHYLFSNLCAGTYTVEVDPTTVPPGFTATACNSGADDTIDNDCSPATVVLPADSSVDTTTDFAYACSCDDGDVCTDDSCGPEGCVHTQVDCNDNTACTIDTCDPIAGCQNTPVNGDDNNACTTDICDPKTGIQHIPIDCDDGIPCTTDDCDTATGCTHIAAGCDDGDPCTDDSCDKQTGACTHTPVNTDDGNLCTIDSCDPATGVHHDPVNCDNGNACNIDGCDPASGCTHTVIDCDDHDKCTDDSCDPATGCVNVPVSCDDGDACSRDDCVPASGCTHVAVDCTDDSACTNDSCNPATGCLNTPITCDDENACTDDACDPASGCTHTLLECGDGDPCTNDACDPATGCTHTPVDVDDSNACTDDSCDETGVHNTPISCDDSDACTDDACDPATGCTHDPRNCDDADSCTSDACDPSTGCTHSNPKCDDGNPCTDDHCTLAGGCVSVPIDADDGNACTLDSCDPETGVHHTPISCDDGDSCTTDACDPASGCTHDGISCDDENACTTDTCDLESGCHHVEVDCNDNNACTTDSCRQDTGCQHAPVDCDDDDRCTTDTCDTVTGCSNVATDPTPPECRIPCRITGGGQTPLDPSSPDNGEPDDATFGGQVGAPIGRSGCFDDYEQIRGSWDHQRHAAGGHFHAKDFNSLICTCDGTLVDGNCVGDGPAPPDAPANKICFTGVGDFGDNSMGNSVRAAFRTEIEDRGEPGRDDVYRIRIWIPGAGETPEGLAAQACCTIPNSDLTIRTPDISDGGRIIGGNLQIHRALKASF